VNVVPIVLLGIILVAALVIRFVMAAKTIKKINAEFNKDPE
jgi:hypothetical protein